MALVGADAGCVYILSLYLTTLFWSKGLLRKLCTECVYSLLWHPWMGILVSGIRILLAHTVGLSRPT